MTFGASTMKRKTSIKPSSRRTHAPRPVLPPMFLPPNLRRSKSSIQFPQKKMRKSGTTPSYSLESKLGDTKRAAAIRREALQRVTGKSLHFDYDTILGQCCEMPVGYIQIPVGIARGHRHILEL